MHFRLENLPAKGAGKITMQVHNTSNLSTWAAVILVPRRGAPFGQRKSAINGLAVTLRTLRVKSDKCDWFWPQSIVFTKPFRTGI